MRRSVRLAKLRRAAKLKDQMDKRIAHTPELLAWAAGFFDGEGCVGIGYQSIKKTRSSGEEVEYNNFQLRTEISQKVREPLDVMVSLFGGEVGTKRSHGSVYFYWHRHNRTARVFLEAIFPYLIVKRKATENALEFQKMHEATRPKATLPRSEEARIELRKFYERSKQLNTRNPLMDYTVEPDESEKISPERVM